MADQELMAKWAKITEPREALSEMIKHSQFIGSDPYYRHLDAALWEMAERADASAPQRASLPMCAAALLDALAAADTAEKGHFLALVGITAACFDGEPVALFLEQLKIAAGRIQ